MKWSRKLKLLGYVLLFLWISLMVVLNLLHIVLEPSIITGGILVAIAVLATGLIIEKFEGA